MNTMSDQIDKIAQDLTEAQKEISNPTKDAKNPFFKSTYADLPSVLAIAKDVLPKHGMSFVQVMETIDSVSYLVTILMHKSGQWIKSYTPIACKDHNDPQKMGSGSTYARRYGLQAIIGVVGTDDDDDGNKAASEPKKEKKLDPYISQEKIEQIENFLKGHDDIHESLLKACGVLSLKCIRQSQLPIAKEFVAKQISQRKEREKDAIS